MLVLIYFINIVFATPLISDYKLFSPTFPFFFPIQSQIDQQISTSLQHSYDDSYKTRCSQCNSESSGLSSKIKARQVAPQSQQANQQTYTFTIDITIPDKTQIPRTQVTVPNDIRLSQATKIALQKIKLELELLGVFVSVEIDKYKPRLAKKNGRAKTDMPCLDYEQILIDMKIKYICLDPKDDSCVYLNVPELRSKQSNITFQKPSLFVVEEKKQRAAEVEIVTKTNAKENFESSPYASPPLQKQVPPPNPQQKCFCLLF